MALCQYARRADARQALVALATGYRFFEGDEREVPLKMMVFAIL